MGLNNSKSKVRLNCILSFFLSMISFLTILFLNNIMGNDNGSILRSDLYAQYVPFISNFIECLKGNGSIWYSFSNYLGSGNILNVSYYAINPFNAFFLLDGLRIENVIIIIITLKISLAATAFSFYGSRNLSNNELVILIMSLFYGLCGFSIIHHYNIMWLDVLYILPILIHNIIDFIKNNGILKLVLIYAYMFIINFYMAYICGVFTALFFVVYIVYNYNFELRKNIKIYIIKGLKFAFSVLLAAGLCCIILLPTVGFLYSHIAEDNLEFTDITITLPDILNSFYMGQMTSYNNEVPFLYCGIIILPLVILFFINKEILVKDKILWGSPVVFYLVSSLFKPLYAFLHAFDYPNFHAYRYAYILVFIIVSIACKSLDSILNTDNENKKNIFYYFIIFSIVAIFYYSFMMVYQKLSLENGSANTQNGFVINLLFILLWLIVAYYFIVKDNLEHKLGKILIIILTLAEIIINSNMLFDVINKDMENISDSEFNQWYYSEKEAINNINDYDKDLYRTYVNNEWCYNASNLFNFNSINTFSSSDNYELRRALNRLGLSTSNREIESHTLLPAFDSLFGIKYVVNMLDYDSYEIGGYNKNNYIPADISINNRTLSFGYMVSDDILQYQLGSNCFDNIENLCNKMTGLNENIYENLDDFQVDMINMNYFKDGNGYVFYPSSSAASTGAVQFSALTDNPESYGYFYYKDPAVYGMSPLVYSGEYGIITTSYLTMGGAYKCDFIDKENKAIWGINSPEGQSLDYRIDGISFASFNEDAFDNVYDELSKNQMQILSYKGDSISARVTATEDKNVLFTSIPYDPEWVVLVDGVPATIYRVVGDAFMAFSLEPGEHKIDFYYIEKYSTEGAIITFVSVLILAVLLLVNFFRRNSSKTK